MCVKPVQQLGFWKREMKTTDLWYYPGACIATRRRKIHNGREGVVGHCCRRASVTLNIISPTRGGAFATQYSVRTQSTKSPFQAPATRSITSLQQSEPAVGQPVALWPGELDVANKWDRGEQRHKGYAIILVRKFSASRFTIHPAHHSRRLRRTDPSWGICF